MIVARRLTIIIIIIIIQQDANERSGPSLITTTRLRVIEPLLYTYILYYVYIL